MCFPEEVLLSVVFSTGALLGGIATRMDRPHPGQKAAESGICAAQSGQIFNADVPWSIAGNISNGRSQDKSDIGVSH